MNKLMKLPLLKRIIPFLTLLIVLLACQVPGLSQPAASNPAPVSIETIVFQTASVAQTQTALYLPTPTNTPTETPLPTSTFTETPTPTATIIFIIPTSTKPFQPYSAGVQCELISLIPYNPIVAPRSAVEIAWTFQNIGDELWLDQNIDFKYVGGKDMHKTDAYDLPNSVPPNSQVTLTVPMVAPKDPGTYTTDWVLGTSKQPLCKVSATIIVK